MSLNFREIDVINIIVQAYIQHATSVGSRYVARQSGLGLSPASMRNIMADLTEKGYLTQPYTSAGRIPTQKAFRFYVDSMLKPGPLSKAKQGKIREYLTQAGLHFSDILEQTSKLISTQASQVGMAVAPQRDMVRWQQIDFVLVRPGLVLAVLVFQGGIVQNKLFSVEEKLGTEDLIKFSNYLNQSFQGQTIFEVKKRILEQMQEAKNQFNALYAKALRLAKDTCNQDSEPEIFLEGTLHVLDRLDNKDLSSMRELLEFLEQRSELLKLLEGISRNTGGLSIVFGTEFYGPELGEWGMISSPYQVRGQTLGVVGTIGPIRMDYSKLVPMVDCIAKMLSEILETRF